MQRNFTLFLLLLSLACVSLKGKTQINSLYDQLVYVNPEWKNQADADPQLKLTAPKAFSEQQLVQLHLSEVEKLLRKRDVSLLSQAQRESRKKNLDVLHQYLVAGIFPFNARHKGRQPYFIDDNNVYCAVGYLIKESGADDVAREIKRTQNYSFLADIYHDKLMSSVLQSGLAFDELALIQPGYGYEWPAVIVELHYNNTGTDVNEYIEIHQSSGGLIGMIPFDTVLFYDGSGTLYKTLPIGQMQSFTSSIHHFYYYVFPSNENMADDGRIQISGWISGAHQLISVNTYTGSSFQVTDYTPGPGSPTTRSFSVGENESTLVNFSLNFCDFYYSPGWNISSMATTIGSLNACLILPVSLNSFSYTINDKKVNLTWEIASENNNKEFIVERSANGTDFQPIGHLPGAGNSSVTKQYGFTDNSPGYINYYRLTQLDFDGRSNQSKILYVKVPKASPLQLIQTIVNTDLRYQVSPGFNESSLEIYDMNGRTLYKAASRQGTQHINLSGWAVGKYLMRLITNDGQIYTSQFIKQ
jgi:hypothetical protein